MYSPIKPNKRIFLKVDSLHTLYVEECGNKKGIPALYLHGGPGGSINPNNRRIFNPRKYIPTARPGHRAPHIWLEEGVSIYDKFGKNFTLLVISNDISDANILICEAKNIGIPIKLLQINDQDVLNLYKNKYVIIRPDLMVAWRSDSIPDKPVDILNKITGVIP